MYDVMHSQIGRISKQESRKEIQGVITHDQLEDQVKDSSVGSTHKRRHGQSVFVLGIVVMNTMNGILKFVLKSSVWLHVEEMLVHHVFHESEGKQPKDQNPHSHRQSYRGSRHCIVKRYRRDREKSVIGTIICVLEILSKSGLENIWAEPKLSGLSNRPIFFMFVVGLTVACMSSLVNINP